MFIQCFHNYNKSWNFFFSFYYYCFKNKLGFSNNFFFFIFKCHFGIWNSSFLQSLFNFDLQYLRNDSINFKFSNIIFQNFSQKIKNKKCNSFFTFLYKARLSKKTSMPTFLTSSFLSDIGNQNESYLIPMNMFNTILKKKTKVFKKNWKYRYLLTFIIKKCRNSGTLFKFFNIDVNDVLFENNVHNFPFLKKINSIHLLKFFTFKFKKIPASLKNIKKKYANTTFKFKNIQLNDVSEKTSNIHFFQFFNKNFSILKYFFFSAQRNNLLKSERWFNNKNLFFKFFFSFSKFHRFFLSNYNIGIKFNYIIKKIFAKDTDSNKSIVNSIVWSYSTIIRFLEHCSGKKVLIKTFLFINSVLSIYEYTQCQLWAERMKSFQRSIGYEFSLVESIRVMYLAFKLKDLYFLINWMRGVLHKINFWKLRRFFHYLSYVFKFYFSPIFKSMKMKGIKIKLSGKISVAGNARTRSISFQYGFVSNATYENKIVHSLNLIRTFTGVMGLQVWLVF